MNNPNFEIRHLAERPELFLAIRREDGKTFGPAEAPALIDAMNASDKGIEWRAINRGLFRVPQRHRESRIAAQQRRIRESEERIRGRAFTQLWEKATPV